jgi:calcineurin-like phosphoesterase family protein
MKKQSKIFITSDTFFGRKKAATQRGFSSAEEMNITMAANWNKKVTEDDIVIHLGNFAWSPNDVEEMIEALNGNIIFMPADHDQALMTIAESDENISIVQDQITIQDDVVLCHWPLETWVGKDKGKYHFHGHTEPNIKTDLKKMLRVNICCDNWSLAPIEIADTLDLLKDFQ